jgi:hypothetical protein
MKTKYLTFAEAVDAIKQKKKVLFNIVSKEGVVTPTYNFQTEFKLGDYLTSESEYHFKLVEEEKPFVLADKECYVADCLKKYDSSESVFDSKDVRKLYNEILKKAIVSPLWSAVKLSEIKELFGFEKEENVKKIFVKPKDAPDGYPQVMGAYIKCNHEPNTGKRNGINGVDEYCENCGRWY